MLHCHEAATLNLATQPTMILGVEGCIEPLCGHGVGPPADGLAVSGKAKRGGAVAHAAARNLAAIASRAARDADHAADSRPLSASLLPAGLWKPQGQAISLE